MGFNKKLQELRKEKKLSQEQLAESIDVSRQAIAKWESGKSYPEVDKLIKLSNLFGVSLDKLLKDIEGECAVEQEQGILSAIDEELIDFLCKAKKQTYAKGDGKVQSSRPNSHDLQYVEDDFRYIDSYLGSERFIGEEAVWVKDTPVWSMNYSGRVFGEGFSGNFLKQVLLAVPKDMPYRGPNVYQNGDYKYHCIVEGEFEWFKGYEEIYFKDKKIYECLFHGGKIK